MEACQQEVERLAQNEHKRGVDQHNLQSRGNLLDKVNAETRVETEGEPAVEALAVPVLSQKIPRSLQSEAGGEDRHGLKKCDGYGSHSKLQKGNGLARGQPARAHHGTSVAPKGGASVSPKWKHQRDVRKTISGVSHRRR